MRGMVFTYLHHRIITGVVYIPIVNQKIVGYGSQFIQCFLIGGYKRLITYIGTGHNQKIKIIIKQEIMQRSIREHNSQGI